MPQNSKVILRFSNLIFIICVTIIFSQNFIRGEISEADTHEILTKKVTENSRPVVVQYHAPWCAPCKSTISVVNGMMKDEKYKCDLVRVDVSKNFKSPRLHDIRSVPALQAFKDGKPNDVMFGAQSKNEFESFLDKHCVEK